MSELATREARAQTGVLQFAEEMQAIRDGDLYPNAGKKDGWKKYCEDRWGQSIHSVDGLIRARSVLERRAQIAESSISVKKAKTVATLPESVQDVILADDPREQVVVARAKAARAVEKKAKRKGVDVDPAEMAKAAAKAKPKPKVKKPDVPEELKDENLPPKLTPEDHGSPTRKLVMDALFTLWRANEKLKDEAMDEEAREALDTKLEKLIELARHMQSVLRGEGGISDEDLERLLENANG